MELIKRFKSFQLNKTNTEIRLYFLFVFIRILLVLIPQSGYIHPDEFFQTVEVIAGDTLDLEHVRTWEFDPKFPIRSMTILNVLIKLPLKTLKFILMGVHTYIGIDLRQTYILLMYPRLIMCLLSFINDYCLYKICKLHELNYDIRLLALSSSYVMLIYGCRTFSNTIEMCLCSLLLYVVVKCMVHSHLVLFRMELLQHRYSRAETVIESVRIRKLRNQLPNHSVTGCISLANLCVFGLFNRPTFILFALPIVFYWFFRGMGSTVTSFMDFNLRVLAFILASLPTFLMFIVFDSIYYGYLTAYDLMNLNIDLNQFVVTPLNFMRYNLDPELTAQHGKHPQYLHLLVNIPLLFNVLGIIAICSFIGMILRFGCEKYASLPHAQSIVALLNASIFIPLALFSLINHQEPRFLLPLTIPIILLHSKYLQSGISFFKPFPWNNRLVNYINIKFRSIKINKQFLCKCWFSINIALTIFYGFIHQAGVYPLIKHFSQIRPSLEQTNINYHLITSHLYSVPMSLFYLPNSKTIRVHSRNGQKYRRSLRLDMHEYGGDDMNEFMKKIKLIYNANESLRKSQIKQQYAIYLAMPMSLNGEFLMNFNLTSNTIEMVKKIYPHLSTEAMPNINEFLSRITNEIFITYHHHHQYNENKSYFKMLWELANRLANECFLFIEQFGLVLYRIDGI